MGYDISTRLADKDKAEQFAKKYGYGYMFNKESGVYEGDATPYFRANIWGMGTIRQVFTYIYTQANRNDQEKFVEIMNKFSWNDGAHVTAPDCEYLITLWDKDKAIDAIVMDLHTESEADPDYLKTKQWDEDAKAFKDYTATVDEVVDNRVALCEEFIDYLGIAKELDGCLVW